MEDLNSWVASIAGWMTVLQGGWKLGKWLIPKIRESLRIWRATRKR
ncbi:MAG: hypothetical protein IKT98_10560 [Selenomonadaceae bacterium]|nr:hypothetical protein [Selenomonadaceae bacterium]